MRIGDSRKVDGQDLRQGYLLIHVAELENIVMKNVMFPMVWIRSSVDFNSQTCLEF